MLAEPIPGGCAQTSSLKNDANITPYYTSKSTTIYFQVHVSYM